MAMAMMASSSSVITSSIPSLQILSKRLLSAPFSRAAAAAACKIPARVTPLHRPLRLRRLGLSIRALADEGIANGAAAADGSQFDFDLFTIGAGSGGVRASRFAAGYGARVAICELPFATVSSETTGGVGGTLLTPPGTPHFSPSNVAENLLPASAPDRSSSVRSISNTRTSRRNKNMQEAVSSYITNFM